MAMLTEKLFQNLTYKIKAPATRHNNSYKNCGIPYLHCFATLLKCVKFVQGIVAGLKKTKIAVLHIILHREARSSQHLSSASSFTIHFLIQIRILYC